jgi:integrase
MPLSDAAIRKEKPTEKPVKKFDTGGLFLIVTPAGGKWWRLRYRFGDKEKLLSLGVYPDVGLREARVQRDTARELLAKGIDPGEHRKEEKADRALRAVNSFEVVTREWCEKKKSSWVPAHADRLLRRFERDIFPTIGKKPIADIKPVQLLAVIRTIEARGARETAHRALQDCGQVMRYAIATGRAERDIAADLRGALEPVQVEHYASVTEPAKVAELLRTLDGYQGSFVVQSALRLAPLLFVRPGELRQALWEDIDLDAAEWRYTVTKTKTEHLVPLASQAVAILRELHALTGSGVYVFPGHRSAARPMSNNAVLAAMRSLGIDGDTMTGHGFRAMARTVLDEVLGVRPDFIEHQLAHAVRDANGRAYNRTSHLGERKKMMQVWADYLDKLKAGAEVVPIKEAA